MLLRIERSSGVAVYRQLARQIRYQVAAKILRPGTKMPSVRSLAEELSVNQNTILKAYTELCEEGILKGEHGRGTYVEERNVGMRRSERREIVRTLIVEAVEKGIHLGLSFRELEAMVEDEWGARGGDSD